MKFNYKIISLKIALLWGLNTSLTGQNNFDAVYQIFQNKCIQCHNNNAAAANLNLLGNGATSEARKSSVHNNLLWKSPDNDFANSNGNKLVYPGRVDKSLVFKKINNGLEHTVSLNILEGSSMPPYGEDALTDYEKEIIRQWILYGAKLIGRDYDESTVNLYYAGDGLKSFPADTPAAPDSDKGIQIKMGPFYIEPGGEVEYFQKHELTLPFDAEINRIDMDFGNFSHHFLLYDFKAGGDAGINHGFRRQAFHQDVGLIAAAQGPTSLALPNKTAFFWNKDIVLDLNSHYINYSGNLVHQAEVYVNIYFEEQGNALHEMHTALIPKTDIYIPNNNQLISFSQPVVFPGLGEIFVWTMAGHTHKYGRSYKVFKRNPNGSKGALIYDGACAGGVPECINPYFDYQHIPFRVFEPLLPLNMLNGFIHEASFRNDGPIPVTWGPTSDDEMMLVVLSYVRDTIGITNSVLSRQNNTQEIKVFPNPSSEFIQIENKSSFNIQEIDLYNLQGKVILNKQFDAYEGALTMSIKGLPAGIYILVAKDHTTQQYKYSKVVVNN